MAVERASEAKEAGAALEKRQGTAAPLTGARARSGAQRGGAVERGGAAGAADEGVAGAPEAPASEQVAPRPALRNVDVER